MDEKDQINLFLTDIFSSILTLEEEFIATVNRDHTPGISVTEAHIIEKVGLDQSQRMGDLAAGLGVTMPTMTIAIERLCRKGLVQRRRSEQDRRVVNISLTDPGRQIFLLHQIFHEKLVENLTAALSDAEIAQLQSFLGRINHFFTDLVGKGILAQQVLEDLE
ncbi:MarR family winged helix-turn-helix transcriptional regulator [Neobittarella massiliensis]|uniref:Winged helix-turn-helix transcriptional regulator n=2 Tax=Oscillospiraceae TaxID=216572 RepID=A0A8J6IMB5_9FIRM|nr:MarR family winged helix-turn-helix transcriptional regulator [Neobittarella massiliensis]MBC3517286.1 winged helix-turn-helix transcriptional regulator [Neobittarella massiliensis]SCJ75186.1 transcriptional regulator SlyA [uncultured Anaerotruncus sp.]